ncbi:PAS domain-containing protein [Pontibacter burrus]|uniref:histidine kinase n=1 Tax=Pontibacter burrus TaxID=2704466 RepID=A0A6B3LRM6_9BACT|nr:PAS domain-containing protein [Pontibacter burrus]NEM96638.1 PAS domain-containing protein [Pontibacter burrus]
MSEPEFNAASPLGPIFRALPVLYMVMDPNLTIIDATDTYLKAVSGVREQLVGQNILEILKANTNKSDQEAKKQLMEALQDVLSVKTPQTLPVFRFDIETAEDRLDERFWETCLWPIVDAGENMQYVLLETRDVTHFKQQELENSLNLERLNLLAGAIDAATWDYDPAKDSLYWTGNPERVLGYGHGQMPASSDTWRSLIHQSDLPLMQQQLYQAKAEHDKIWAGEYRIRKADGTYAHILDQRYIFYDADGNVRRMIGSIIDISKNRQAELEVKESDARFKHLLEALPFMAWTATPEGQLINFNRAWHSFTGMPDGDVDKWISYIHPEDAARALTTWHESIRTGLPFENEYRVMNKLENRYQWFMERGVPLFDEAGKIKLWIGSYADVHEQKMFLEQL